MMPPNTIYAQDQIENAFADLCALGYFARTDWQCCQQCGWAAVPDDNADRAVFFHGQDTKDLIETGACFLSWSGDSQVICDVLGRHGIATEHDGRENVRIKISLPKRH
jgi:hypothetical protein